MRDCMSGMAHRKWHALAIWLPAVGTAAAGAVAFAAIATVNDPTTDRAERLIGGAMVAFPFLLLLLLQVGFALYAANRAGRPRQRGLLGMTLGAALASAVIVALFAQQVARGYAWHEFVVLPAALVALLVLPLPPAWMARDVSR